MKPPWDIIAFAGLLIGLVVIGARMQDNKPAPRFVYRCGCDCETGQGDGRYEECRCCRCQSKVMPNKE